ncbi:DEHA2E02750p [Debaryomyces hansenii CBS767]|uniref:DEHA2E02750p n=1 Tax=Debaryomyces hansenii (strain ATCC 36239 / CBS 767 / BCRC 21394 / JCM 1990 / NBRC 0083 / IGC 2968) TaxID=284592 RepID=Q6BQS2_DEBHA|nr:DEHA2E02750p [Debaryomyces hansenii CBS767]CAG87664.2 DEHA2E02750p [Debaryomyces hansenii CBS767]|eukprot:XP_459448.2 DEHA2E02750p [Debaryomyces hansenii CBS767]
MGAFNYNDNSIEGDVYIQRLSTYVRRNEEALANGLMCFSKNRTNPNIKPLRLSFTIHHLYYITERIESSPLGVDVGPLNIKLDNPNHVPTFISFMANNARSSRHFDSDAKSITSINSMRSIVSSASVYWRSFAFSKDPKVINKDLRYLYSSFTKVPCLILTPKTKINSITSYEEYPCDTSVPVKMFKNLQVLELVDYEPNEIFGWNILSEQLRVLIIKDSKISDIGEILFNLVIDDESGRSSFNFHKPSRKQTQDADTSYMDNDHPPFNHNSRHNVKRERDKTTGAGSAPKDLLYSDTNLSRFGQDNTTESPTKDYYSLTDGKWSVLKQLTISETSITSIRPYVFKPLGNLVKLNLSNNLLESLPEGLDQLHNIKYLNFADNYITDLKALPKNLKYLSTMNFNNNKLESLEGLENLCSLEKIDFRRNELKEIKSLKPIILQFIKNPEKFDNVYLANNALPKNYRIELFNLFNGVKYKNSMKIDDSRPGYFESALLLDAESAFKSLEKLFGYINDTNKSTKEQSLPPISTKVFAEFEKDKGRDTEIQTLLDPLATMNLISENDDNMKPRKVDISHIMNMSTMSPILSSDSTSIVSASSKLPTPNSPLYNNQNLTNKQHTPDTTYTAKPTISTQTVSVSSTPPVPTSLKRSTTLNQLDIESPSSNNAAPGIITNVQVTARMST